MSEPVCGYPVGELTLEKVSELDFVTVVAPAMGGWLSVRKSQGSLTNGTFLGRMVTLP